MKICPVEPSCFMRTADIQTVRRTDMTKLIVALKLLKTKELILLKRNLIADNPWLFMFITFNPLQQNGSENQPQDMWYKNKSNVYTIRPDKQYRIQLYQVTELIGNRPVLCSEKGIGTFRVNVSEIQRPFYEQFVHFRYKHNCNDTITTQYISFAYSLSSYGVIFLFSLNSPVFCCILMGNETRCFYCSLSPFALHRLMKRRNSALYQSNANQDLRNGCHPLA